MDSSDEKTERGSEGRLDWLPIEELSLCEEEKETWKLLNESPEDEVNKAVVAVNVVEASESEA